MFVNTDGMINQSIFILNLIIVNSANKSINHRSIVIPWVHACTPWTRTRLGLLSIG